MQIIILKLDNALKNFNYIIVCPETREALVIDPLDAEGILETAQFHDLKITQIVNTHEHGDHTGGNHEVKAKTNATIMAHHGASDLIPGFDMGLKAGDTVTVGKSETFKVLDTPGHTMHHVCLFNPKSPAILTGDTLFNCGCGNCYNGGDPAIMFETFENQLQHLPDDTSIYPGHDYLLNNLKFVKSLQPDLPAIGEIERKLTGDEDDVYISTLGEDKTVDPFFRLEDAELIHAIKQQTELADNPSRLDVFLALRSLRDEW